MSGTAASPGAVPCSGSPAAARGGPLHRAAAIRGGGVIREGGAAHEPYLTIHQVTDFSLSLARY